MKQIQPFQKHWLQLTSIVVCRLNTLHNNSQGPATSGDKKGPRHQQTLYMYHRRRVNHLIWLQIHLGEYAFSDMCNTYGTSFDRQRISLVISDRPSGPCQVIPAGSIIKTRQAFQACTSITSLFVPWLVNWHPVIWLISESLAQCSMCQKTCCCGYIV